MKSADLVQKEKEETMQAMQNAIKEGDDKAFVQAFTGYIQSIEQRVMNEARAVQQQNDTAVLTARGVRQLTSEEKKFYESFAQAIRSGNPKQALTELEVVMPKTVIDEVFEDLADEHPILGLIDFQNVESLTEFLMNTHENQLAVWGELNSAIVQEITSGFKKINLGMNKLSAFIPVSQDMLDLGPQWIDRYVRLILADAIYNGLEKAIVCGTGKNEPIGMNREVGDNITLVNGGEHPEKAPIQVTNFLPEQYGQLIAPLTISPNGHVRKVGQVLLLVNPTDYLTKVMPATTIMTPNGTYTKDVFPFATTVEQSIHLDAGKAILGLPKRYFMGVGTGKKGKIEYSDDYRFLEDDRVYKIKMHGHGQPKDNNSFIVLDISDLKPAALRVLLENASEAATEAAAAAPTAAKATDKSK